MSDTGYQTQQEPQWLKNYPGAKKCSYCNMWLSCPQAFADHEIGKKHKNNIKRREKQSSTGKIVIPAGTAMILEQQALEADAVMRYTFSLYRRAAIRANL